jgi:hypothetical protein
MCLHSPMRFYVIMQNQALDKRRKYENVTDSLIRKCKVTLCISKHHVIKVHWLVEVKLQAFLIYALDGSYSSACQRGISVRPSTF